MKRILPLLLIAGVSTHSVGCNDKPTVTMPPTTGQPKQVNESGVGGAGAGKKDNVAQEKLEAPPK